MAELADKLSNEERLSALINILEADGSIPSGEAWPDSVTRGMRPSLLKGLQPLVKSSRTARESMYEISPEWIDILFQLVRCLEKGADLLEEAANTTPP